MYFGPRAKYGYLSRDYCMAIVHALWAQGPLGVVGLTTARHEARPCVRLDVVLFSCTCPADLSGSQKAYINH